MTAPVLEQAIARYDSALKELETAAPKLESRSLPEKILAVLIARQEVEIASDKLNYELAGKDKRAINQLDKRLKQQVEAIKQAGKFDRWRAHLNPPAKFWWWFLDSAGTPWWNRYDWLWSSLSVACLTASLSLVVDISSRFLSGGPDPVGTFAVIAQSLLTLLAGGSALTKPGQEGVQQVLENLKVPKGLWHEVGFSSSLLLLLGLLGFHQNLLPAIAAKYNSLGAQDYAKGKLSSAEYKYNRALKLYPDFPDAHYNLGIFYESLQDLDKARSEYQMAVKGGQYKAATNLSRLYILAVKQDKDNYSKAISWLSISLPLVQNDPETKYAMLTNLGWARLGQEEYIKAENHLQEAINLIDNKAPGYCLLAQVMEKQKRQAEAAKKWEQCIQYANQKNPDEDAWLRLARQRLQPQGNQP